MKPALQKSPISENQAFEVKYLNEPHFDSNWHFHSEYQLFTVIRGTGTRFVGDHVSPFKKNDLVFTGPNLPHLWQSDPEYFNGDEDLWTEGVVIYFHENFIGNDFLHKNETYKIKQLFIKAQRGMEVLGNTSEKARGLILELLEVEDFERILKLLSLLDLLANSTEYNLLANEQYSNLLKEAESDRMNKVHAYVLKNFREKITLEQVAAIANMSSTSFSRYFKMHANKTFSDFLTEIRIGYSCKLLIEKSISISEACYESGFNTISNFNRQFKSVTHHSPLEYKRKYLERIH
ncbi:MAG TPA: AraC family transcriptional regulator [Chryseolinea sp.]|nr:AraC family transcriptional regulator [Chryseolinea sp.]